MLNDDGVTIIMITHDRHVAEHAKTIKHILDGRIYDNDEIDEVLRRQNDASAESEVHDE